MKERVLLLFLVLLTLCSNTLYGQMVGDNVFLQGAFVEIGVAPNGGYGSTTPAPAGYHPYLGGTIFTFYDPLAATTTTSGNFLGFVADYGADGWTVGTPPYFGDFYLPGDPQEGWAITVGGVESDAYIPIYETSPTTGFTGGLAGTNVAYSNSGGVIQGIWKGTDGALAIRQTTILDTNKLYFTVNVVLTNTGATPLTNIYYIRTVDPDNDETRYSGDYTTVNKITYQLPDPTNRVLVSTTGNDNHAAYLGLGTKDCRAKCMIFDGGLAPEYTLDQMWNETTSYYYAVGTTYTEDVGIALDFNIGTIAPGDSTSLSYAYILNATYIDSALNATELTFSVNGVTHDSTDTINLCSYAYDTVAVNISGGGFYSWSWAPDSFLTDTSGTSSIIHSDSIVGNLTYTITGTNIAGGCNDIHYYVSFQHATFPGPVVTPTTYCQDATAVPLTAPGTGLLWWTVPTGGTGSSTAPTPSTTTPGTTVYYVSSTFGLCQSLRSPDTVNIIPLPLPPILYDPTPYCQGQTFVPITVTGTGILWYTAATGGVGTTTAPTVNTAVPGTYTFWASQTVNGCEGPRASITITVLDFITPAYTYAIHYGCHGDTVTFTNSSVGAIRYTWVFGDGTSDTTTSPVHVFTTQDTFDVKLIAINGQCADSMIQKIRLIHPLHASFSNNPDILCQDDAVTFLNTSIDTGGTYLWSFGNGATDTSKNPVYTYLNTGVYNVQLIVTDFVPCRDTATGIVYVDTMSGIDLALTDTVICQGTYVTYTGLYSGIGNTGNNWSFGDGNSIVNVNPVVHGYNTTGVFTITVTAIYRACPDTSVSHTVTVIPQPYINLGADTSICKGSESVILADNLNGGNPAAQWLWSTGQTGPSIVVDAPGYYFATVNINNCYASDTVWVQNGCYLDIPNVFSPNGDGVNDYFFPRQFLAKGLTTFSMNIYNRWGQLIFTTTALDGRGWDGKFNSESQPEGVYVYVIDATFKDGQKEHHQGNVTLLR